MMRSVSSIPAWLRSIFCVLALLTGALSTASAAAAGSGGLSGEVQTAVDDAMTRADPGDSKMAPITSEVNKMAKWLVILLWVIVPLVLFGGMIAWGVVLVTRENEIGAAKKIFGAVAIGVIFYFGVLTIFF